MNDSDDGECSRQCKPSSYHVLTIQEPECPPDSQAWREMPAVCSGLTQHLAARSKYVRHVETQVDPDMMQSQECVDQSDLFRIVEEAGVSLAIPLLAKPERADSKDDDGSNSSNSKSSSSGGGGGDRIDGFPSVKEFYRDLTALWAFTKSPKAKTYCFQRLHLLQHQFDIHKLLNAQTEAACTQPQHPGAHPHKDFASVCKVDTHVHLAACMTAPHLLRFMQRKLAESPEDVVLKGPDGEDVTLRAALDELGYRDGSRLTVADLGVTAGDHMYHRFDQFSHSYSPLGSRKLRAVFLATANSANVFGGTYLAEMAREVFEGLREQPNVRMEPRISIHGRSEEEWTILAKWAADNGLLRHRKRVRWIIQVPRVYPLWKKAGYVQSFGDMLANTFQPLLRATLAPSKHPELHAFLQHVVGFDLVADESVPDPMLPPGLSVRGDGLESIGHGGGLGMGDAKHDFEGLRGPREWSTSEQPPYSMYMYYYAANIRALNQLRASRGLNQLAFRPHCGEAGPGHHMATGFLLAHTVNHGIALQALPALQYMFMLARVGLSVAPLSNSALTTPLLHHPFPDFFKRGLHVTLSTDDPLMFHSSEAPLLEEYTIAKQTWRLSNTDLCEVARNSVLQSGFTHSEKSELLGPRYKELGAAGNHKPLTNVPNGRAAFRHRVWLHEMDTMKKHAQRQQQQPAASPQ